MDKKMTQENETQISEKEKAKLERFKEQAACQTFEELADYGRRKGYKEGWAKRIYEIRQKNNNKKDK